jgi:hypothetical protein
MTKPIKTTPDNLGRAFKTAWFAKEARKAKITDEVLCHAISQVMKGQSDDLGGGVYKKRLNDNMHRSIILAKAGQYWIYAYLYAKKDRENIAQDELVAFKKLAKDYSSASDSSISALLTQEELWEICHDN